MPAVNGRLCFFPVSACLRVPALRQRGYVVFTGIDGGTDFFKTTMLGLFITGQEFEQLSRQGLVVDARRGGLVIGRSHDEGNIYMIQQYLTGYRVINHMEGGEYVICHEAIMKHKDRIIYINSLQMDCQNVDIDVLRHTPLLVTQLDGPHDKFLLFDVRRQFVVNKGSTCYFLEELNRLNKDF